MAKYRNKFPGNCELCGEFAELTKDHLPQRGLYPKSIRNTLGEMNSVNACEECNGKAKQDDEFLKVVMGDIGDVPWQEKAQDGVRATLEKNHKLARMLDSNAYWESVRTPDGETRKVKVGALSREESQRFFQAVARIIKGLYFQTFGEVLVERHEISDFSPEAVHPILQQRLLEQYALATEHHVNRETVRYRFFEPQLGSMVCYISIFETFKLFYVIQEKRSPQNRLQN